ncbi:hypothetical protein BH24ACT23_BH24ACT23_07020 [soil metagenome]
MGEEYCSRRLAKRFRDPRLVLEDVQPRRADAAFPERVGESF